MALNVDSLKNFLHSLIPHLNWREEQEILDARAAVDNLDTEPESAEPESAKLEPAEPQQTGTPSGIVGPDGSPFTGLNTSKTDTE